MNTWGQSGLMAVCAVDYCLGRQTYITGMCADWLEEVWSSLPERAQYLIQRDVERAFTDDDMVRHIADEICKPLGGDEDRAQWERVRKLWRTT